MLSISENHAKWLESLSSEHQKFIVQLQKKDNYPELLAGYASAVYQTRTKKDRKAAAIEMAEQALILGNKQQANVESILQKISWYTQDQILGWHYPMVHDHHRNKIMQQALEKYIVPGKSIVYEIGTGSGIISMIAARAGAKHVYTCELYPLVAQAAEQNIQKNGYKDQITVIQKSCFDVELGKDLPAAPDIFISEIVDSGLLSYGVLPMINDCWEKGILTTKTKLLPQSIAAEGVLVGGEHWCKDYRMNNVDGFDLSAFNVYGQKSGTFTHAGHDLSEANSLAQKLLSFDLSASVTVLEGSEVVSFKVTKSGLIEAVLMWLALDFDEGLQFSNAPIRNQPSWRNPMLYFFDQPVVCEVGDGIKIEVTHKEKSLEIKFKEKVCKP